MREGCALEQKVRKVVFGVSLYKAPIWVGSGIKTKFLGWKKRPEVFKSLLSETLIDNIVVEHALPSEGLDENWRSDLLVFHGIDQH